MVPISDASFSHLRLRMWGAQAFRCRFVMRSPLRPSCGRQAQSISVLGHKLFFPLFRRHCLVNDTQSEWAARARRSLKFCEMQMHLSAASVQP
jgi:hypothetical protein